MRKYIIFLLLLALGQLRAQYVRPSSDTLPSRQSYASDNEGFWNKVSVGGGFGLSFGDITLIDLAPLVNYHINNGLIVGAGPIYQYLNVNDPGYLPYNSSVYGGRISAMVFLPAPGEFSKVFLMGEYDVLNVPEYVDNISTGTLIKSRGTIELPFVGIGFRQPVGGRSYFMIMALWDLSQSPYSPYLSNPVVSAGIDLGL